MVYRFDVQRYEKIFFFRIFALMIIGYDAKRAFCNNTGLGNYSRMVIGGVAERDTEVVLYTPRRRGRHEHYFDEKGRVKVRQPQGLWHLAPALWRSVAIGGRLGKDGVDLFHGLSHELPYGIPKGVKKVVTMHDLIVFRHPEYFKPIDRLIHRVKMRHACEGADVVVAISEQTKADLITMLHVDEAKIRVVYQSCDPLFWHWCQQVTVGEDMSIEMRSARLKYGLPERYVLCVGTVEPRKNQAVVVRAMGSLPDDVALAVVGRSRSGYGEVVRKVAEECGVARRVFFIEGAAFADFPALYAGAVASVYMSRFEGFGIPVLEAMCCDTPVVTSSVSSMPEAGGEAALYAEPDDVATVAKHLRRLMEDRDFRAECVEKGRLQREKFAPEKVTEEMLKLYRTLL